MARIYIKCPEAGRFTASYANVGVRPFGPPSLDLIWIGCRVMDAAPACLFRDSRELPAKWQDGPTKGSVSERGVETGHSNT
jgi:hypothetical protein